MSLTILFFRRPEDDADHQRHYPGELVSDLKKISARPAWPPSSRGDAMQSGLARVRVQACRGTGQPLILLLKFIAGRMNMYVD
jgi:hypothetical protein